MIIMDYKFLKKAHIHLNKSRLQLIAFYIKRYLNILNSKMYQDSELNQL